MNLELSFESPSTFYQTMLLLVQVMKERLRVYYSV